MILKKKKYAEQKSVVFRNAILAADLVLQTSSQQKTISLSRGYKMDALRNPHVTPISKPSFGLSDSESTN